MRGALPTDSFSQRPLRLQREASPVTSPTFSAPTPLPEKPRFAIFLHPHVTDEGRTMGVTEGSQQGSNGVWGSRASAQSGEPSVSPREQKPHDHMTTHPEHSQRCSPRWTKRGHCPDVQPLSGGEGGGACTHGISLDHTKAGGSSPRQRLQNTAPHGRGQSQRVTCYRTLLLRNVQNGQVCGGTPVVARSRQGRVGRGC